MNLSVKIKHNFETRDKFINYLFYLFIVRKNNFIIIAIFALLLILLPLLTSLSNSKPKVEPYLVIEIYSTEITKFKAFYNSTNHRTIIEVTVVVRCTGVPGSQVGTYVEIERLDTGEIICSDVKIVTSQGSTYFVFNFEFEKEIGNTIGVTLKCTAIGFIQFREAYDEKVDVATTVVT